MKRFVLTLSVLLLLCLCGCQTSNFVPAVPTVTVAITSPTTQTDLLPGATENFVATVGGVTGAPSWSIYCSASSCGTITFPTTTANTAAYVAPALATGTTSLVVTVEAFFISGQNTITASQLVVVQPAMTITTTGPLAAAAIGKAYSSTLVAQGGSSPYTWAKTAGNLPAGLSVNSTTGVISGTPTTLGTMSFTVTATDSTSPTKLTVSATYTVSVNGASTANGGAPPTIATTALPNGTVTVPYVASVLAVGGVTGVVPVGATTTNTTSYTYAWAAATGSCLPAGLSINATTGLISGTPTTAQTCNVVVKATDSSTPATLTASATLPITIVTAASIACAASDTGDNALLNGTYVFSIRGFNSTGIISAVGSFTANGSGGITTGEVDTNGFLGLQQATITPTASSYTVGTDQLGCLTLSTPFYNFTTRIAVGGLTTATPPVATEARMIEWETGANAYIATGHILQQPTLPATITAGNYAFEYSGVNNSNLRLASGGVMTATTSAITAGALDMNNAGVMSSASAVTGTVSGTDAYGRLTVSTTWTGMTAVPFVGYLATGTDLLYMTTSAASSATGVQTGEAKVTTGTFTAASLGLNIVYYSSGLNSVTSGGDAQVGLLNASAGTLASTIWEDNAGVPQVANTFTCTYAVSSLGRVTLTGSGCPSGAPNFYLWNANTAWVLGTGPGVQTGQIEAQVGSGFTNGSILGTYYLGDMEIVDQALRGTATLDLSVLAQGSSSFSILTDSSGVGGLFPDQSQTGANIVFVNANGTFSSTSGGPTIGVIISGTKAVVIDNNTNVYPILEYVKQ